jgi:Gram-negative bacterial TonB protein C-terminal
MLLPMARSRVLSFAASAAPFNVCRPSVFRGSALLVCSASALLLSLAAVNVRAQQAAPSLSADNLPPVQVQPSPATPQAAQAPASPSAATPAEGQPTPAENQQASTAAPSNRDQAAGQASEPGSITEDELRKQFEGKDLFLRGGYLDNTLTFNERGVLIGHSPQGSYTLAGIRIEKVRLLKHKVELTGARYALHFLGALPSEDPTTAVDRVNITPKKKEVRITIDRELVVKPKQEKGKGKGSQRAANPALAATAPAATPALNPVSNPAPNLATVPAPNIEPADAQEAQAEMAATPEAERPADAESVTATLSPAHANKVLEDALGNVFAQGFDERMMASMPAFWKLYYDAVADKADYQPADSNVLRQNMVDKKAQLKSTFEPGSNEFAQDYGVAGISEYHVVVGADGKPVEISVARPIGFGLDESAVDSIRKATFEPAVKDGKPVSVLLDMVVEFRIYSKRTEVTSNPALEQASTAPLLPGPYSVQH